MKKLLSLCVSLFGFLFLVPGAPAQVLFSTGTYNQNFDSLLNSGTANPWTDNSTLLGWYASKTVVPNGVTAYRAGPGDVNNGALYSFGANGSTERALGSVASGTPAILPMACDSERYFAGGNDLMITYTGEQWRNGGNTAVQTLVFSYRISNTSITDSDALNGSTGRRSPL